MVVLVFLGRDRAGEDRHQKGEPSNAVSQVVHFLPHDKESAVHLRRQPANPVGVV